MVAYPITPASEIMEYMIANVTKVGGTVVQTEDEIAAPIWQLVLIMQVSEHSLLVWPRFITYDGSHRPIRYD